MRVENTNSGLKGRKAKIGVAVLVSIAILVAVFNLGVNVGDGRVQFGKSNNLTGLPTDLNYSSVSKEYSALKSHYDGKLTEQQVLDGIKHGLASSTNDPYTEYFTPSEAKAFNNELNSAFSGIGAELGQDASGNLQIIAPISGTPAANAGLKAGDLITNINGVSTAGINVDSAIDKIRGKAGTKVTLNIVRDGQPYSITITRQNITIPSVNTKILNGNIGYMQITTFADDTSALAQKAANDFANKKVKGIVLDLRDNPGGLLSSAVDVSSLWLPKNDLILKEKTGGTVVQTYNSEGDNVLYGIPTVILINSGSASASEITTGALKDNNKAYVIGTKSYGKGVVQQLLNFNDGSQLKVTIASWFRPNGQNINKKGITPDQIVKMDPANSPNGTDSQLSSAENYLSRH